MKIIFLGFVIRISIAIINIYFFSLPGGEYDAGAFHQKAIEFKYYIEAGNSFFDYQYTFGWIYSIVLGYVYYLFGSSELLGSFLSCLTWLISAVVLREIMIKLSFSNDLLNFSLFVYCVIFPSSIFFTSFTLREAYLLLFSNLLILLIVNFLHYKNSSLKIINGIFFILISICMFNFHKAGAIFILMTIMLLILIIIINKIKLIEKNLKFILILFFPFLFFIFEYLGILEEIFIKINSYQQGHFDTNVYFRAHYYEKSEIVFREYSVINFITIVTQNIINYFYQPTNFSVTNFKDFVSIYENNLRLIFLFFIFYKFFFKFQNKPIFIIIFLLFALMESIYAQATVNYGTASRHHVTSLGFLVLLIFFPLKNINRKILKI